jgi:hypothetical protein
VRRPGPRSHLAAAAKLSRLVVLLREGFITPSPPGACILDVKQELRYRPPVRRWETHRLADTATICGLPLSRLVINVFQPAKFVIEQRTNFREPGRWPDLGVEPREVRACHYELGQELVTADELPHAAGFAHGTILPSDRSAA